MSVNSCNILYLQIDVWGNEVDARELMIIGDEHKNNNENREELVNENS